jgi:hypothetical protein
MSKIKALSLFLSILPEESEELIINEDYLVYTNEEANEAVKENIRNSLWSFNADFLCNYVNLESKHIIHLQKLYEDSNEIFLKLLSANFNSLVRNAINLDGRGHFLAGYDGIENEITITIDDADEFTFYIYRCN